MSQLQRQSNEGLKEYKERLVRDKDLYGLSYQDIADYIEEEFDIACSAESIRSYRRRLSAAGKLISTPSITEDEDIDDADDENKLFEIIKETQKLKDINSQIGAYYRRISREETLKEIAKDVVKDLAISMPLINSKEISYNKVEKEAIICLSDWHYGIEINNAWNKFNTDICRERLTTLTNKVIDIVKDHKIKVLNVVDLGDLICGRIHLQLRLQSRIDVITQVMHVSEILAEMINIWSKYCQVTYRSCLDNHSRVEPNKKESLDLESLQRITKWFLRERLVNNKNVFIYDNEFGDEFISFTCLGHEIGAVHGHQDRITSVVSNVQNLTKHEFDLILLGHDHHFCADEKNETIALGNGTLMGSDQYSLNYRLTSKPSQNLIIVTEDNVIDDIKRILV